MPTVFITTGPILDRPEFYVDTLCEAGFEIRYVKNHRLQLGLCSNQETIDELRGAHVLFAGVQRYSEQVLAGLPELRVIALRGVGIDCVDVAAATARGIAVAITPTANHEAVAEHALAFIFALAKSVVANHRLIRRGGWEQKPTGPIRGKTLGILGLGRIGRSLALRALALQMKVLATEKYPEQAFLQEHRIELVDLDTLLAHSDYLSLNCPLTEETRGLFHRGTLAKMKPGSVLINTARGALVVEADLAEALRCGPLRAAGLDVFEQEPTPSDNPLQKLDNVLLSPHIAGADELAIENVHVEAAQNVIRLYRGQWPEGAVINDELRERWLGASGIPVKS